MIHLLMSVESYRLVSVEDRQVTAPDRLDCHHAATFLALATSLKSG